MNLEQEIDNYKQNNWKDKSKKWAKRYLPAEIISTLAAYAGSKITYELTKNETYAAYIATQAGNLAYYGWMLGKDIYTNYKTKKQLYSIKGVANTIWNMILEFGPSGGIDALITRPLCTKIATEQLGREVGVLTGRLAADILFYTVTIFMYEKIHKNRKDNSCES